MPLMPHSPSPPPTLPRPSPLRMRPMPLSRRPSRRQKRRSLRRPSRRQRRRSLLAPEPTPETTVAAAPEPDEPATTTSTTERPLNATPEVIEAAYTRLSESRQSAGLGAVDKAVDGDSAYIPIFEWIIGCYETADQHADLMRPDIDAIGLAPVPPGASECAVELTTYHYVPDSEKMRVEQSVWDCFADSRDIREGNDVSCGGRYSFIIGHVKWLPSEVYYSIEDGEAKRSAFVSHIPWIEQKLGVRVDEAASSQQANLFLYLDSDLPAGCGEAQGCNVYEDHGETKFASIYINTADEFFGQVLKHEVLHALLPMGHVSGGEHLMSVRSTDPYQTQDLSALEEKLLALYTHPYLEDGMEIDKFRRYLIIQ